MNSGIDRMNSWIEACIERRPHWVLILISVVSALLFSGGVSFRQPLPLFGEGEWVAYAYKSRDLSADMTEAFPAGSHASKLTTRITFPAWVALTKLNRDRLPAWLLLQSTMLIALVYAALFKSTNSRSRSFVGAMLLGSTVVWSISIWPSTGFSDGMAWILCAVTLLTTRPIITIALGVAALWTDERSLFTLICVALFHLWKGELRVCNHRWVLSWVAIIGIYLVSRLIAVQWFGWGSDVGGISGDGLVSALCDNAVFLFLSFKFAGLALLVVIFRQFRFNPVLCSTTLVCVILGIMASHLVHDITRSIAYLYPLILISVIAIKVPYGEDEPAIRYVVKTILLLLVAMINFSIPSIEVIRSSQLHSRNFDGQIKMLIRDFW